ncbi:Nucleolar protein-like protein [Emericellopsis cladophorae]|uniref:Nucleolar protein-like protein n=1 Tax=Emericellopsis cladophorae TaxID=2686198 RepID=A0A9P9Y5C7_9HYPO|nr:Nucleolar protein-like protein [Emericellopsis cladophorae]KAI6783721.1 Nucleolar protein-like protein [Emericellopsis cladophorae]
MGKLGASSKAIDPTLDALFASSAGPVQDPSKTRQPRTEEKFAHIEKTTGAARGKDQDQDEEKDEGMLDDEDLSEASGELEYDEGEEDEEEEDDEESTEDADEAAMSDSEQDAEQPASSSADAAQAPSKERKRKRKDEHDDLEDKYLTKLTKDDQPAEKRHKVVDKSDDGEDNIPQHESLAKDTKSFELEKADRTVFLANVASAVINSKADKKTLLAHLASVLDADAGEKVESIRFRSTAFSAGSMPKRAAFITKQLMEATTKSTNAYAVFSSVAAANKAIKQLNGSEVLGRHIRVDSVSHPTPTAHRRCVFVGNLGFMDDESVLNTTEDGETVKKKRNKVPADVEEGLWRTFSKSGRVENVRVVRDPKTRDGNSVESALLLDGKKFPPMLPRLLRVTRAKDPRKTALAQEREREKFSNIRSAGKDTKYKKKLTPEELSQAGRAGKLLGRSGAAQEMRRISGKDRATSRPQVDATDGMKTPEQIVLEGTRASVKFGKPKDLRFGKKKKAKNNKPAGRGTRRAAEWRSKKKD